MGLSCCRYYTPRIAKELGVSEEAVKEAMKKGASGGVAKIWRIEDKGKYCVAEMSVSVKHNEGDYVAGYLSNGYDIQWANKFVRLIGNAKTEVEQHEIPKSGLSVRITNMDIRSKYDPEAKKEYTNYTIMALDVLTGSDQNANKKNESHTEPSTDEKPSDLPF